MIELLFFQACVNGLEHVWAFCFKTQKGIRGWLRIGSQEKLSFSGELLSNSLHPNGQAIKVGANVTQRPQVK